MRSPACLFQSTPRHPMTDTTLTPANLSALRHLQRGMQQEFTETLRCDEQLMARIIAFAAQYVTEQVPFTSEEAATELAMQLAQNVVVTCKEG